MEQFGQQIIDYFQNSPELTNKAIRTLAVILIISFIRFIGVRVINNRVQNDRNRYKWRKNFSYTISFFGLFIIIQIWFAGLDSLATFLGLLSAGIAIALKDPITSLAGWLFLIWRRPFDVGDRIEVDSMKGDVIDIRMFKFTLLEIGNWVDAEQSTGRVIHIPNHEIFTKPIYNYTSDFEFIWNELSVLITFESDWKLAKEILTDVANTHLSAFVSEAEKEIKKAKKSYLIQFKYLTPIVYTDVKDSGVNLTIRYLANPRTRRGTAQRLWEDILERFGKEERIDFAYPTIRYYDNPNEGKSYPNHPPREV